MNIITYLMAFKSWSNTKGVVTVAIDNNARQPSSISLDYTIESCDFIASLYT